MIFTFFFLCVFIYFKSLFLVLLSLTNNLVYGLNKFLITLVLESFSLFFQSQNFLLIQRKLSHDLLPKIIVISILLQSNNIKYRLIRHLFLFLPSNCKHIVQNRKLIQYLLLALSIWLLLPNFLSFIDSNRMRSMFKYIFLRIFFTRWIYSYRMDIFNLSAKIITTAISQRVQRKTIYVQSVILYYLSQS